MASLQRTPVARDILIIPESRVAIDWEINSFRLFSESTRAFIESSYNACTIAQHQFKYNIIELLRAPLFCFPWFSCLTFREGIFGR